MGRKKIEKKKYFFTTAADVKDKLKIFQIKLNSNSENVLLSIAVNQPSNKIKGQTDRSYILNLFYITVLD